MSDFFRRLERMQFDQQNMLRAQRGEKTLPIPERLLDESERPKKEFKKSVKITALVILLIKLLAIPVAILVFAIAYALK